MTKVKKLRVAVIASLVACLGFIAMTAFINITVAYADNSDIQDDTQETTMDNDIELYGLFASVTLYMDGGNGEVCAGAKNTFTLLPSVVRVTVELYSSDTYQDDYKSMTLVASNYIADLNMGKSIEARVSTGGLQKYYKGRAHYTVDGKDWKEIISDTFLYNADGIVVR